MNDRRVNDSAASVEAAGVERSVTVGELLDSASELLSLTVAAGASGSDRKIRAAQVQKSGLALAGHFHGITSSRIQLLGVTEMTYLHGLDDRRSCGAISRLFERDLCCVVVTDAERTLKQGSAVAEQLLHCADDAETPLLLSRLSSSATITALHTLLAEQLAPRARVHGVLMDVFEVGLLLLGSSGVGKSEVALELIMRGHRLVADDVVDCQYRPPDVVFGAAANLLKHHLEVRGLGILNIKNLFGVTSVRDCKRIDVVVQLAQEGSEHGYDRLGLEERSYTILGIEVPELVIPVRPGRDMASIMEVAARNELLKQAGHHPARDFVGRLEDALLSKSADPRAAGSQSSSLSPDSAFPASLLGRRPTAAASPRTAISRPPESIVGYPWQSKT